MTKLLDDGLVRAIGVSNFEREEIERCEAIRHVDSTAGAALDAPSRRGRPDPLVRRRTATGEVSYAPLGYGLLTGAINKGHDVRPDRLPRRHERWEELGANVRARKDERSLAVVEGDCARSRNASMSRSRSSRSRGKSRSRASPPRSPGAATRSTPRSNAAAGDVELDAETLAELDRIVRIGPDFG
jgi:aryl-alcohol dehydrogenase-like predicted oxidoreductase